MPRDETSTGLPRWAIVLGSVAIAFHLINALITTLHSYSGPWLAPVPGGSPAEPPPFTVWVAENVTIPYNRLVKVNHSFHFNSTRQEAQEIAFEAVVKDGTGKVVARQKVPDPEANLFVRQRQSHLARQLIDVPMTPPQGVVIAPAGQELPTLYWWQPESERYYKLQRGNANTVPRNLPNGLQQPSDAAFIAARSFGRFLRRAHDGTSVELIRTWRDPIYPTAIFAPTPPEIPKPNVSSYGELPP